MADDATDAAMLEDAGSVMYAKRPDSLRALRACTGCKLVKSFAQFVESFCDNCHARWSDELPSAMKMGDRLDIATERTTADFQGLVSMMRPSGSWVARWLRMRASGGGAAARARARARAQQTAEQATSVSTPPLPVPPIPRSPHRQGRGRRGGDAQARRVRDLAARARGRADRAPIAD